MKLKITTDLPCLQVTVWQNYNIIAEKRASDYPISFFKASEMSLEETRTEDIIFENLPNGIYSLRASLPYFNHSNEQEFMMPIIMDLTVIIRDGEDVSCTIKTQATITQNIFS